MSQLTKAPGPAAQPSRIKAVYRGIVLGWFDGVEQASAAVDTARAEEQNEDAAFLRSKGFTA
jgi:hypothetical protein